MADRPNPAHGTPNWDMIQRWLHLEPDDECPFDRARFDRVGADCCSELGWP